MEKVRFSHLKAMAESPKSFRHAVDVPREDTPAMRLGRAVHCAVLEPQLFAERYAVRPAGIDRRTKEGKAAWEAFLAEVGQREILDGDEHDKARRIGAAVRSHEAAAKLLEQGVAEQALSWTHEGRECSGRADWIGGDYVLDLKTTSKFGRAFPSEVARRHYHAQLAWYIYGATESGMVGIERGIIIAVDSAAPHDVAVYELSADALWAGEQAWRSWMQRLAACEAEGQWPGQSPGLEVLELPAWAYGSSDDGDATDGVVFAGEEE
jgi:exodeoxyribonuclease VIII